MGIQIDFLAVGDASKSGDAIAVRFGNLHGRREDQTVITIDGGTRATGEELVEHVKTHFGTSKVDFAFLTHPDGDHASGMSAVLENLEVGKVLMHRPWEHSAAIQDLFDDGRTTPSSISDRSRENLTAAHEIETLALAKGIEIMEPFAGVATTSGTLRVLGPTREYYREVLSQFDYMPDLANAQSFSLSSVAGGVLTAATRAINWIAERWDQDLLVEPEEDATSAENNSSVVLLITPASGKQYLLTGDAGVLALTRALDYATTIGLNLTNLGFFQVPHHGSKRNLGPAVLNRLLGGIQPAGSNPTKTAFISCAKDGAPKHPNKRVTNALLRRGVNPFTTAGKGLCHADEAPARVGWSGVTPLPFHSQVEDDD